MDNKFISLGSKVLMAVLLVVGVILIKNNLSYDDSADEPTLNQALYAVTVPASVNQETGEKIPEEITVYSSLVVDNDAKKVYDLDSDNSYELAHYRDTTVTKKEASGKYKEEDIDPVLLNNYNLGSATVKSVGFTYWLMWGGLILIGVFSIFNIIQNPKRFVRPAIGFGILGVLAAICYAVVDKVDTGKISQTANYSPEVFHYTGFGIALFIALTVIAGSLIVVGSVIGMVRYLSK
jgi:hypothetical protein